MKKSAFIFTTVAVSVFVFGLFFEKAKVFAGYEIDHYECMKPGCYLEYTDWHCHCCVDYPPPGCDGASCPVGENLSCEENLSSLGCTTFGGCNVYFKGLNSDSPSSEVSDSDLADDVPALMAYGDFTGVSSVGHSKDFLSFYDSSYDDICTTQHRNYAYIYVPTGWWSFGLKVNQSVMDDPLNPECYYCADDKTSCGSDWWVKVTPPSSTSIIITGDIVRPSCGGQVYSWIGALGSGTSGNPYIAPTPTRETLAENFLDYSSLWKELVSFDSDGVDIFPSMPKFKDGSTAPIIKTVKTYTYSWLPILNGDDYVSGNDSGKLTDGATGSTSNVVSLDPNSSHYHIFRANFGSVRKISGFYLSAFAWGGWQFPDKIDFVCNGALVGSWTNTDLETPSQSGVKYWADIYANLDTSCQVMDVGIWASEDKYEGVAEARFYGETETDQSGGSQLTVRAYGSKANGSDYFDDGYPVMELYIDEVLAKTFYVSKTPQGIWANYTYTHSGTVKPEDVRVAYVNDYHDEQHLENNLDWYDDEDPSKSLWVDKLIINGTSYETEATSTYSLGTPYSGTPPTTIDGKECGYGYGQGSQELKCNGYFIFNILGNRGDSKWSGPKYFAGGWYPVELSADWGKMFLYNPQLWWRKYNPASQTYSDTNMYSDGVGEAKISSCSPGEISCSLSVGQSSVSMIEGTSPQTVALILSGSVETNGISITSSNTGIVQVAPLSASGSTTLILTPVAAGTALVSITGTSSDGSTPCDPASITVYVTEDRDFWQVEDMDVTTTADLVSYLDSGYFDVKGGGEYPGIPVYGGDNADFDNGSVSEKGWIAGTGIVSSAYSGYTYSYFMKSAPSDDENFSIESSDAGNLTDGVSFGGYTWREYIGNLSMGSQTLSGTQKLVIFIDGNLTLDGNLILNDKSFLMFVVSGNIVINPAVTSLEGVFFAGNEFQTGAGSSTLNVRGSVVALGGVDLERDLPAGGTSPSEYFTYGPDLLLAIPYDFGARVMSWKEVSPSN